MGYTVVWTPPDIRQKETGGTGTWEDTDRLNHRLIMGEKRPYIGKAWQRTILGCFQGIRLTLPPEPVKQPEALLPDIADFLQNIQRLGTHTIFTDGGCDYKGNGLDTAFYPNQSTPSYKGDCSIVFMSNDWERIRLPNTDEQTAKRHSATYRLELLEVKPSDRAHRSGIKHMHGGWI